MAAARTGRLVGVLNRCFAVGLTCAVGGVRAVAAVAAMTPEMHEQHAADEAGAEGRREWDDPGQDQSGAGVTAMTPGISQRGRDRPMGATRTAAACCE